MSFAVLDGPRLWLGSHSVTMRRVAVIAGVLAVSLLVGLAPSLSLAAVIVGLPIAVGFVLTLLRYPQLLPLVLIAVGLLAPRGPSDNFNPTILMLVFLTGLWVFDMVVRHRVVGYFDDIPVKPALALVGAALLAFLVGQLPWFPLDPAPLQAQFGGFMVFLLSMSAFLMTAYYVNDVRWLKRMVWLLVIIGAVYVFARVLPRPFRYGIALFPWGSTSTLFWLWLTVHTFTQMLFNRNLRFWQWFGLLVLFGATIYAVGVQTFDWRSGWIPPVIAIGTIVVLRWPKLGVILALSAVMVTPYAVSQLIAGDAYSYSTRVGAWVTLWNVAKVNPITGVGPSNYYWYTPLYLLNGYSVNFNSHNQYADLILQTGVLGLAAYLWFFAAVGLIGWRLKDKVHSGFEDAYVYACLGGLVAMLASGMLGDWILPFVYNVGLVGMRSSLLGFLYLGGLVALSRIVTARTVADTPGDIDTQPSEVTEAGVKRRLASVPVSPD